MAQHIVENDGNKEKKGKNLMISYTATKESKACRRARKEPCATYRMALT